MRSLQIRNEYGELVSDHRFTDAEMHRLARLTSLMTEEGDWNDTDEELIDELSDLLGQ